MSPVFFTFLFVFVLRPVPLASGSFFRPASAWLSLVFRRGVTPLMYLMQAVKPDDERGEEAMAHILAVMNKVPTDCCASTFRSYGLTNLMRGHGHAIPGFLRCDP